MSRTVNPVSMQKMMGSTSRYFLAIALLASGLLVPALVCAGNAHEHGAVNLNVAVEAGRITLQMESPLENLLGFERAPRTDAERKSATAMVARLKAVAFFDAFQRMKRIEVQVVTAKGQFKRTLRDPMRRILFGR